VTAPSIAPENIATTDSTLLANLGLLPFAIEESAAMPVVATLLNTALLSAHFRLADKLPKR
jgi:hypothetical protein